MPILRRKRKEGAKWVRRHAGNVEVMAESIRADTQSESWRERVPDFSSGSVETAGAK